jgi:hypothetical protein
MFMTADQIFHIARLEAKVADIVGNEWGRFGGRAVDKDMTFG